MDINMKQHIPHIHSKEYLCFNHIPFIFIIIFKSPSLILRLHVEVDNVRANLSELASPQNHVSKIQYLKKWLENGHQMSSEGMLISQRHTKDF